MKDLNFKPEPEKLSDKELYEKCRMYGEAARAWRQKFLGLLPEVYRRKLYEKKGFGTIFEFAAKLAGVSENQVSLVLNLEKKFQDKPDLHNALVQGEVSVNKLRRITSIATSKNQKILLEHIKILPQKAVETWVRDLRDVEKTPSLCSGVGRAQKSDEQLPILQPPVPEPQLSDEVKQKLYELQRKNIDINELILAAIAEREQKIAQGKNRLAEIQEQRIAKKKEELAEESLIDGQFMQMKLTTQATEKISRHIPIQIRRLLNQEYGTKCAMPNCRREAAQIHHEIPFSMLASHNPHFLKPLCKEHHVIAHGINLAYQRARNGAVACGATE